jgi:hypothetical protein
MFQRVFKIGCRLMLMTAVSELLADSEVEGESGAIFEPLLIPAQDIIGHV